jgi:hypothetical protein
LLKDNEGSMAYAASASITPTTNRLLSARSATVSAGSLNRPHGEERRAATRLEHRKSGLPDLRIKYADLG